MATTTTIPNNPDIEPAAVVSSASAAQAWVDAGYIVLLVGNDAPVPTLNGDIDAGHGWWSYLPIGSQFTSRGHVYRVVNRVWLSVHGGQVSRADFGGDLDLHTCTRSGSTITWGQLVS